jgi:hypothetical protein
MVHESVDMKLFFNNGFGISITRHYYTKGSKEGLFEIAVLFGTAKHWNLTYATPVTDDVVGWLSWTEVLVHVGRVAMLEFNVVEQSFD